MQMEQKNAIHEFFASKGGRRAVLMSGCAVASWCFGMATPDLLDLLRQGFSVAVSNMPFANTESLASLFFDGAKSFAGSVALGAADQVVQFGGKVGDVFAVSLNAIRSELAGITSNASDFFVNVAASTKEVVSLWRNSLQSAWTPIADSARSVFEMIPSNPADAAASFGKIMKTAIEAFGLIKGAHEAYKWTLGRFKKEIEVAPKTQQASAAAGLSIDAGTNITINIAIGGEDAAKTAVRQVESILAAGGKRIVVDEKLLRSALSNAIPADAVAADKARIAPPDLACDEDVPKNHDWKNSGIFEISPPLQTRINSKVSERLDAGLIRSHYGNHAAPLGGIPRNMLRNSIRIHHVAAAGIDVKRSASDTISHTDTPSAQWEN